MRRCACGFDPFSVDPPFGPGWHTAHRDHHLTTFPFVDQVTRDNLASFIERSAIGSEVVASPPRVAASDRVAEPRAKSAIEQDAPPP